MVCLTYIFQFLLPVKASSGALHYNWILFGVVVNALAWFESYLTDRAQSVADCVVSSDPMPVDCGVVQASILSVQNVS